MTIRFCDYKTLWLLDLELGGLCVIKVNRKKNVPRFHESEMMARMIRYKDIIRSNADSLSR